MADDGASKRTVKINDFKAPEEWYQALKRAAQEDDRTVSEAIIHLVSLGLKVRKRLKASESLMIDEAQEAA